MAIGLLTVVLLLVMGVFTGGLRLMSRSEQRTQATQMAQGVLESIADQGGFHAFPTTNSTFRGKVPDATVNGFPPPPYPGNDNLVVEVQTRELTDHTRAALVIVRWASGQVRLEKTFHACE